MFASEPAPYRSSFFNQANTTTYQDRLAQTSQTQDLARAQQLHFQPLEFFKSPSTKDVHFTIDSGLSSFGGSSGLSATTIDQDSQLQRNQQYTSEVHRLNLQPRLFSSVPFMGRGSVDPVLEFRLTNGMRAPMEKRHSTLPYTGTAQYDYMEFNREVMNNGRTNELYQRTDRDNHVFEEHTAGMTPYGGVNTRLLKFKE